MKQLLLVQKQMGATKGAVLVNLAVGKSSLPIVKPKPKINII